MVSSWWSRTPKLLVFAGLFAVAFASFASRPASVIANATASDEYYPGPCTNAPTNIVITFKGATSGCTESNGKSCQPGEVIEFKANSTSRAFQVCDTFTWVFGDDPSHPVTTLWPVITRQFTGNTARTVKLTVANNFNSSGVVAATVNVPPNSATSCTPSANVLCFVNNRYRVTLDARDIAPAIGRTDKTGIGEAQVQTPDTGYFTISQLTNDTSNPEVVVKVLDVPPSFVPAGAPPSWVFFGGLTDLEYFVNVLDTTTGNVRQYHKAPGSNQGGFDTGTGQVPTTDACPVVAPVTTATEAPSTCTPGNAQLCLLGNRFKVTLHAINRNAGADLGKEADGVAVAKNNLFGFFSLPGLTNNPNNLEAFIKMIDATGLNGKYWVFFGTLSNFEMQFTITDTVTGKKKTYNRAGLTACGTTDTSAFPF